MYFFHCEQSRSTSDIVVVVLVVVGGGNDSFWPPFCSRS